MTDQYGSQWTNPTGGPQNTPPGDPTYGSPPQPGYGTTSQGTGQQPAGDPEQLGGNPQQQYGGGYPQQHYGGGYPMSPPPIRSDYASWGKRVGAFLIDGIPNYVGLIIFYIGYGLSITSAVNSSSSTPDLGPGLIPMIVGGIIMLGALGWTIYNRWLTAGRTGQSLGKRVTKIALISEETSAPIGPTNAFLRDLVHTLDGFAYVGYLWPLWDERKQTFSDKIMKTVVINAPAGQPLP